MGRLQRVFIYAYYWIVGAYAQGVVSVCVLLICISLCTHVDVRLTLVREFRYSPNIENAHIDLTSTMVRLAISIQETFGIH